MANFNLGQITTKQKMVGIKLVTQDANGNQVSLPADDPVPAFTQNGVVEVQNMLSDPNATPSHSVFTFDVVGLAPSTGPVTIELQTHNANGTSGFTFPLDITVILDPSTPGPATQFAVTAGNVVSQ